VHHCCNTLRVIKAQHAFRILKLPVVLVSGCGTASDHALATSSCGCLLSCCSCMQLLA
jgi:hypothetical protein